MKKRKYLIAKIILIIFIFAFYLFAIFIVTDFLKSNNIRNKIIHRYGKVICSNPVFYKQLIINEKYK